MLPVNSLFLFFLEGLMLKLGQQTITGKFTILIALLLIFSMTFLSVVTYTSFSQMVDRKVVQLSENLLALAKLYGVAAEELLRGIDRSEE